MNKKLPETLGAVIVSDGDVFTRKKPDNPEDPWVWLSPTGEWAMSEHLIADGFEVLEQE